MMPNHLGSNRKRRRIADLQNREFAKTLIHEFVRNNASLEDLHAGTFPGSATGDYRDVKVISPYGEIPWNRVSRISDEEMKRFMIECVDNIYTFLSHPDIALFSPLPRWNQPKIDRKLLNAWYKIRRIQVPR
jgi:hypothetical protein